MKKTRVTIQDVASAAGVSLMTVSRAINGRDGIGDDTRARILALAGQMGYHPSQIARGLATRRSATIGLLMPDVANPFFAQIARGAEDAAYENGYNVFLINTDENIEREKSALDSLWQKEIDGAILCSPRLSMEALKPYITRFPATVLVNRELDEALPGTATFNVDYQLGAREAVEYFLETGRKHIAFIAGPETSISSQRRLDGYHLGLESAQRAFDPALVENCPPTTEGGRAAALALLARRPGVDAVLCFNDLVAIGVLEACDEMGRNIPADIAVIGADDIPLASLVKPRLTTLAVNLNEMGETAMQMLLELIATSTTDSRITKPVLTIRQTA